MTVYRFDDKTGEFQYAIEAEIDLRTSFQKGEEVFFSYENTTDIAPEIKQGFRAFWKRDHWVYDDKEETKDRLNLEIDILKKELAQYDYVDFKLSEKQAEITLYTSLGNKSMVSKCTTEYKDLVLKYASIFEYKKNLRIQINEKEKEIENIDKGGNV